MSKIGSGKSVAAHQDVGIPLTLLREALPAHFLNQQSNRKIEKGEPGQVYPFFSRERTYSNKQLKACSLWLFYLVNQSYL